MRYARHFGTRLRMALAVTICASACWLGCGCGTRTVLIPHGEPVRLRRTVKNVPIWAADKHGKEIEGTVDLPEGWYALPDPKAGD